VPGRRTLIAARTWSPREGGRRWLIATATAVLVVAAIVAVVAWRTRPASPSPAAPSAPGAVQGPLPRAAAQPHPAICSPATAPAAEASLLTDSPPAGPPHAYLSFSCSGWGPFEAPAVRSRPFCPHGDRGPCYPATGAFRVMFSASGCGAGSIVLAMTTTSGASLGRLVNTNCAGQSPDLSWPDRSDAVAIAVSAAHEVSWTFVVFETADCGRCP
jgi:hypothetical protein